MPNRFPIPADQMRSAKVNAEVAEARMKIRRARKKENGCSQTCVLQDDPTKHASDCKNKDRYDVV